MTFEGPLLGQGESWQRLLAAARSHRLPHGLLIAGGVGTGKSHAAVELSRALLCTAAGDDAGCRACAACRKVDSGNHPDLHRLAPPPDKRDIPVESVRELQAVLARAPVDGGARVVIVDPADRLNDQGQNALLKTLEEPGADTFLLLPTARPEALLPTVLSRVTRVTLRPLAAAELGARLQREGVAAELVELGAGLAGGSLGLAQRLATEEVRALDQRLGRFLAEPARSPLECARDLMAGPTGRAEAEERARAVLLVLRRRVRAQLQAALAQRDRGHYVESPAERWTTVLEAAFAAEEDLALGIGAAVVVDGLFLDAADLLTGRATALRPSPIDP